MDYTRNPKDYTVIFRDNGSGIDTDLVKKIFNAGFTMRRGKGNGFGLAIAKKVIEAHGGNIWAESPGKGQGTSFYIRLPIEDLLN